MAVLHISPTGAGSMNGSSWANAGRIDQLPGFVAAAGPGGQVLLRADQGAYNLTSPITLAAGGAPGQPVTVRGVDAGGSAMPAQIVGTRPDPFMDGAAEGLPAFNLGSRADYLRFTDLAFRNLGDGAFRVVGDIAGLAIDHVSAANVTAFLEAYEPAANLGGTITGLDVSNVEILGYSRTAIRLGYDTSDVRIEDVFADSQRQPGQGSGKFVTGVQLDGTVHDVLIRKVTMNNNFGTGDADEYWNGDGFSTERGVYNIVFEDTVANGNTDAGYDIKSSNTTFLRAHAEDNKKNYRIWSDSVVIEDSFSVNPHKYGGTTSANHIWVRANADAYFINFGVSDTNGLQRFAELEAGQTTLYISDSTIPSEYDSRVLLGAGAAIRFNTGPTGLALDNAAIDENAPAGTVAGELSATDPDAGDQHAYAIIGGASDVFAIAGDEIVLRPGVVLDFEQTPVQQVVVRVTDVGKVAFEQTLQIAVRDRPETPITGQTSGAVTEATTLGGVSTVSGALAAASTFSVESQGAYGSLAITPGGAWTYTLDNADPRVDALSAGESPLADSAIVRVTDGTLQAIDIVITGVNDQRTGGSGSDSLIGSGGVDSLSGLAGSDTLDGGAGADTLTGGNGADLIVVDATGDAVVEWYANGAGGLDTVLSSVSYTIPAHVERLILTGSANIDATGSASGETLAGNAGHNRLFGLGGNDSLDGGAGADSLDGGAGSDTMAGGSSGDRYSVNAATDQVIEEAGGGRDTVHTLVHWTLGANVEDLTLSGTADLRGTGNELANTLVGSGGRNLVQGLDGNDSIAAGWGADTLDGGAGADTLNGEGGADSIAGGAGADRYLFFPGGGDDTLSAAADGDLADFGAYYAAGMSAALADSGPDLVIAFSNGDSVLLKGLHAADVAIDPGGRLTLRGVAGPGNDTITGAAGADSLEGLAGDDSLSGLAGDDSLDGGSGNDTMAGGAGADWYQADSASDQAVELSGAGADTVSASVSYTLGANLEALVLTGSAPIGGTGNNLANVLIGNGGDNSLSGLAGADTLDGGAGADTLAGGDGGDQFVVDDPADRVVEWYSNGAGGLDTILSSVSYAIAAHVERLILTGSADIDAVGGAGAETLVGAGGDNSLSGLGGNDSLDGGAGADSLDGGSGADTLAAGAGADQLTGGSGADRLVFTDLSDSPAGAGDRITGFVSGADRIDLAAIDAVPGGPNDAFVLAPALSNVPGQLVVVALTGRYEVRGDVDGDGAADLVIEVTGAAPAAGDFIL